MNSAFPTLIIFIVVASILKAPAIPVNDPALYEYYGLRLLHGAHLYTDLPEVKLPSIYYLNALYQFAFGQNYLLHTIAEAAMALVTIILFAWLLRAFAIKAWRSTTLLFAVCYCLLFPQYDYPEHYAIPFMLLGFILALKDRPAWSGCALALGTTFWVQTPIMFLPLMLRDVPWRRRYALVGGFVATFVAFAAAFIPKLGFAWILQPVSTWYPFAFDNPHGIFTGMERNELRLTVFHTGLGMVLAILLTVVRRPHTPQQRFGVWWCVAALIGGVIPPRMFQWYFLPFLTAVTMTIGTYGVSVEMVRRRAALAILAVIIGAYACRNAWQFGSDLKRYAANVVAVGQGIQRFLGPHRVMWTDQYVPEVLLASNAVEPNPNTIAPQSAGFVPSRSGTALLASPSGWRHIPDIVIHGPDHSSTLYSSVTFLNASPFSNRTYVPVCGSRAGLLDVYVLSTLEQRFPCRAN